MTLAVVQQQSFPAGLIQQSIDRCILELNDLLLTLIDHAAEGGQQDVPGLTNRGHGCHPKSPVSDDDR